MSKNAKKLSKVRVYRATKESGPYRAGTLYATLFEEGRHKFMDPSELIGIVAKKLKKDSKVVAFGLQVVKNPNHRSNSHTCPTGYTKAKDGKIKLTINQEMFTVPLKGVSKPKSAPKPAEAAKPKPAPKPVEAAKPKPKVAKPAKVEVAVVQSKVEVEPVQAETKTETKAEVQTEVQAETKAETVSEG